MKRNILYLLIGVLVPSVTMISLVLLNIVFKNNLTLENILFFDFKNLWHISGTIGFIIYLYGLYIAFFRRKNEIGNALTAAHMLLIILAFGIFPLLGPFLAITHLMLLINLKLKCKAEKGW